jgi:hypothetical protein
LGVTLHRLLARVVKGMVLKTIDVSSHKFESCSNRYSWRHTRKTVQPASVAQLVRAFHL